MAYLEKVTLTITTSTGGKCAVARSAKVYTGYLHALIYTTGVVDPITANSSSIIRVRSGSTAGNVLVRSSSQFASAGVWIFPYRGVGLSTKVLTETSHPARFPLAQERLFVSKTVKSTAAGKGSTQVGAFIVYIEGSGIS